MQALRIAGAIAALLSSAQAFQLKPAAAPRAAPLSMLPPRPGDMSPETMKQAADALKNLSPDQISQMQARPRGTHALPSTRVEDTFPRDISASERAVSG